MDLVNSEAVNGHPAKGRDKKVAGASCKLKLILSLFLMVLKSYIA